MLNKLKRPNNKGFTIIEVMIVLAIAGLILLIVLLAVPALQRNSRNTQIHNAASTLVGYYNDFSSNSNGGVPAYSVYDANTGNVCLSNTKISTCTAATSTGYVGRTQAGYTVTMKTTNPGQPTTPGTLNVWIGGRCNGSTLAGGTASTRAVSVGYVTETANASTPQCAGS